MHKTGDGAGGVRYPILVQLCEASISRAPALLVIVPSPPCTFDDGWTIV